MSIRYRRDLWKVMPEGGNAAEVGVAEGLFAADMLQWPIRIPKVYLVDRWAEVPSQRGDASNPSWWHHKNYQEVLKRIEPFGERAVILRGPSVDMAARVPDRTLALVNIDADHSYAGCLADIYAWIPKLMPHGIMAFHDYENPSYGVKDAVQAYLASQHRFSLFLLPEDSLHDAGAYMRIP